MKLYIEGIVRQPGDTLHTFLNRVFRLGGNYYSKYTTNATYLDPEFKELHCVSEKHRSFDDIVLISKTYFKVSDKTVARSIIKFLNNDNSLSLVFCDSAKKWVLNYGLHKSLSVNYCAEYNQSYSKRKDCGINGKYSFNDIMTLAGLTEKDFII